MSVKILIGDVFERLARMQDEAVHCVVTSAPYWGMRHYGGLAGEIGLEPTMGEYVETIVRVMREARRVLRSDGTCWLNLGDGYAHDGKWGGESGGKLAYLDAENRTRCGRQKQKSGLKPKDLMMLPNRIAIALQDDGWWVRSEVVWGKTNPMTESVMDRPAGAHEKVWMLSKAERYFYDAFAVRTKPMLESVKRVQRTRHKTHAPPSQPAPRDEAKKRGHMRPHVGLVKVWDKMTKESSMLGGANLRNLWVFATSSYKGPHYAAFPVEIPGLCIRAGTSAKGVCGKCSAPLARLTEVTTLPQPDVSIERSFWTEESVDPLSNWDGTQRRMRVERDIGWEQSCECTGALVIPATVLDPFGGVGTTCLAAQRLKRDSMMVELNEQYALLAEARIHDDDEDLFRGVVEVSPRDDQEARAQ